jgi:hypothetical protein
MPIREEVEAKKGEKKLHKKKPVLETTSQKSAHHHQQQQQGKVFCAHVMKIWDGAGISPPIHSVGMRWGEW